MQIKTLFASLILSFFFLGCKPSAQQIPEVQIIPIPDVVTVGDAFFILNSDVGISSNSDFKISAKFLKDFILNGSGIDLKTGNTIQFIKDETLAENAYNLSVSEDHIQIKASTDQGAFYAVQTLRQLLPANFEKRITDNSEIKIPCVSIQDQPQFRYRGMHLDVGRHLYSVDFIKIYIDALAMLKMNTFHWHLTEDQGWRIEIKKYPKLQEISAYRDETLIGHYSDQPHRFDGKKYGGYYTQDQIKDIVAYAQERFVTIIPEIEMPGHSQAVISAYPEFGCTGKPVEVAKKWGVFEEVYCPSEATFKFLEDVIDEVVTLFPGKYIHIGGDEAPKTRWKNCSHCQKLIKDKGLKDEHGLQSYFIARMEQYINTKGKQIIGWDEILEGGLAPNATVMSWRGMDGAIASAKAGHNVIMTPTSHCYFDYYQAENDDEPLAIGGFLPLEKVYGFNPIPEELTDQESQYVLGAQGNIWTEYMPTEDQVEYMAFPRMLAMSEVLWANPEQKNYADFVKRLEHFHQRLDALDINYANHLYEVEGKVFKKDGEMYYSLETQAKGDVVIRYSVGDVAPNYDSRAYTTPIKIDTSKTINATVFRYNSKEKLGNTFTQHINYHKAVGAKITIDKLPHKAYAGSGAEGLINGISGSDRRYGDKEWLGFWGEDILIEIDLGEEKEIDFLEMRFYKGNGQWIYLPKKVQITYGLDENDFDDDVVVEIEPPFLDNTKHTKKVLLECIVFESGENCKTRYIKIKIPNHGIIPEGKQGAGNKAWTFIDEIVVN